MEGLRLRVCSGARMVATGIASGLLGRRSERELFDELLALVARRLVAEPVANAPTATRAA